MQHNLPQVAMPILGIMPSPCEETAYYENGHRIGVQRMTCKFLLLPFFVMSPLSRLRGQAIANALDSQHTFSSVIHLSKKFDTLFMCIAWQSFAQSEDNGTKIACLSWRKDA